MSTTTAGAAIRYTTDGSMPSDTVGTVYSGPLTVGVTSTIKAIAYASGLTNSGVTTTVYNILVATPTFGPVGGNYPTAQTVTISTATPGAAIRYTIDGSTPTDTLGTLYSAPVTVSTTTTLKAIAYASGLTNSGVATAVYNILAATPTFGPVGGNYATTQTVTLSTTTAGAAIRYTSDGTTPSDTVGTVYSGPVTVGATTTLKAIAYANGLTNSGVATAVYNILVATPTFGPVGGNYASAQTVTLSTTTAGAAIRYTTDGSTPTATVGTVYSGPVTVSATTTFKAIAYSAGLTNSGVATVVYNILVATPSFSPVGGNYASAQTVAIGTTTSGATIRYTTDGTTPSDSAGTLYSGPLTLSATTTLKAIAYAGGLTNSSVATAVYNILAASPTFGPVGGNYLTAQTVTLSTSTSGASIRYTTDGTAPSDTAGTVYSGPVTVSATTTLKAIAYATGLTNSGVATAVYNILVATPAFSPVGGNYATAQTVTLSTTTPAASIRYTTDGTTPSDTVGTSYSGPIAVSATTTLKAVAYATGLTNSGVATAVYNILSATPAFSPAGGNYTAAQTVTIGTTTAGAAIRYTIDGSTPSGTVGAVYSGPITVGATTTLKAVAYASGLTNSGVATAVYNILATTPTFSPVGGNYGTAQTVTIGTTTAGAAIRYTIDGSTPSDTTGTLYSGPITVSATTTLKAIAYASGLTNSGVATSVYNVLTTAPRITSLSPAMGPAGTSLTITGANFGATRNDSSVTFREMGLWPTNWSATSITVVVPYEAVTGNASVAVIVGGVPSNASNFTVTPGITSLQPSSGQPGTSVTIYGTNFGAVRGASTVTFNGLAATPVSWGDTWIEVAVPSGATTGNVVVTVGGIPSNGQTFAVPPLITGLSPTSGAAGLQVTISGSGFGSSQGVVWLGSTYGNVVSWSDTRVVATVAAIATSGTARVRRGQYWSDAVPFPVNTATISTVTPSSGVPGTQVILAGSGFGATRGVADNVWLGALSGVVQSWSDTQVVASVAPGSTSGSARILHNGVMSNAQAFDVNSLHITGIAPTSGLSGTLVTINGTGFGPTQGTVMLGSIGGNVLSWSDTAITASVAPTSLTGIVQVHKNVEASNAMGFTVPVPGGNSLTPSVVNMMVGDTRTLQAQSAAGPPAMGLAWTSSASTVVSLSTEDPPLLTALAAGEATITAGTATTQVTVVPGALPLGTVLWSNPGNGSGVMKIVPAVPSPSGVADVFAFQNDGTVQAITSDGTTAWTADITLEADALPDFQGGLIVTKYDEGTYRTSIRRFDGITGQPSPAYTAELMSQIGVHTDGTVFAVQYSSQNGQHVEVIGIDTGTGTAKFAIPLPCDPGGTGVLSGPIIAGDGNAYVPFDCADGTNDHFALLRVSSSGVYDYVTVADYSGWADEGFPVRFGGMITNADQGVLLTWRLFKPASSVNFTDWMAITTGSSASVREMQFAFDQSQFEPVLQAQNGSFVGEYATYSGDADQYTMVAFDATGNIRWSVANEQPQIATDDGGVIGQSGITYDQNGNATGQMSLPTYSWTGNSYQLGSVEQVLTDWVNLAASWCSFAGGNASGNGTANMPVTRAVQQLIAEKASYYAAMHSTQWPDVAGNNKCNLFVQQVLHDAGAQAPLSLGTMVRYYFGKVNSPSYPASAGDWAYPHNTMTCWRNMPAPTDRLAQTYAADVSRPGDVIAEAINFSDASGHVGIVVGTQQTVSADSAAPCFPPYAIAGVIDITDFGFRLDNWVDPYKIQGTQQPCRTSGFKRNAVVKRFVCQ